MDVRGRSRIRSVISRTCSADMRGDKMGVRYVESAARRVPFKIDRLLGEGVAHWTVRLASLSEFERSLFGFDVPVLGIRWRRIASTERADLDSMQSDGEP